MNKAPDAFEGGKADPLLKEVYSKNKKKTTQKDMRKFSKIRNLIKKQKKGQ